MQLTWEFISTESQKTSLDNDSCFYATETCERKSNHLTFHKKCKDEILSNYLPYVAERSKAVKETKRVSNLYALGGFSGEQNNPWGSINLEHPSTFDTLAMDPVLKKELKDDLDRFVNRREFYKRVGKAWKRLPSWYWESSLIAAMANYLKLDIYDMELIETQSTGDFSSLLGIDPFL